MRRGSSRSEKPQASLPSTHPPEFSRVSVRGWAAVNRRDARETYRIALSLGAASLSRQSLGIAVVGGLLSATFLSLYLVPALYSLLSPRRRGARGRAEDSAVAPAAVGPAPAK